MLNKEKNKQQASKSSLLLPFTKIKSVFLIKVKYFVVCFLE